MTAKTEPSPKAAALTVEQAAELIQVSKDTVCRWIAAGHLRAFVRPGGKPGASKGRKSYRIWREDWDAFTRANTGVAAPAPTPARPSKVMPSLACGTDGVRRRKPNRAR